jgi:CubicO group peptidase (beta-lactamase class C family)
MKNLTFGALLLLIQAPLYAFDFQKVDPRAMGFDAEKLAAIQGNFEGLYQEGRIPNYVMGVYSGGKNIYLAKNGNVSIEGGKPVDENTIYWLASMTKPIVSTAILRLQEEGKLNLDDKLSKYFPEFADMLVAPGGSYTATLEPAKQRSLLRILITHTSGLTYGPTCLASVTWRSSTMSLVSWSACRTHNRRSSPWQAEVEVLGSTSLDCSPWRVLELLSRHRCPWRSY